MRWTVCEVTTGLCRRTRGRRERRLADRGGLGRRRVAGAHRHRVGAGAEPHRFAQSSQIDVGETGGCQDHLPNNPRHAQHGLDVLAGIIDRARLGAQGDMPDPARNRLTWPTSVQALTSYQDIFPARHGGA